MKNNGRVLSMQQLESMCPMISGLPKVARENGLDGTFIEYKEHKLGLGNVCNRDGIYFVIFRDEDCKFEFDLMTLDVNRRKELEELIDNLDEAGDCFNTKYCMRALNSVTRENSFAVYNRCLRDIHDLATVKVAYGEFGYRPPEYVAIETVYAINNFIDKRFNPNIPRELRKAQDEGMEKFIHNSVKRYKKNKPVRFRTIRPHMVRRDYFIKNHVSCINCAYSEKFLKYLEKRWDECPDFVMYKEKRPCESHADRSKAPKWMLDKFPDLANYWADLKGYKLYRVSYPAAYEETMNGWMFDYLAKERENWEFVVPLEELDRRCELRLIEVDDSDIHNWISLCNYNNVKCAINHGEMGEVKDTHTFSFIYSAKDQEMVNRIKRRLSRELSEFKPLPEEFVSLGSDGIKQLEEKERAYADKMAKKRARKIRVKEWFGIKDPSVIEEPVQASSEQERIEQEEYSKRLEEEERDAFLHADDDYTNNPWGKYGYERGHEDYDI